MPLRLKFAIGLSLIVSAAILIFPSCGFDGCADIPVLSSISPTSAPVGGPPLLNINRQALSLRYDFFLRRYRTGKQDDQFVDDHRGDRRYLYNNPRYDRCLGNVYPGRNQLEWSVRRRALR